MANLENSVVVQGIPKIANIRDVRACFSRFGAIKHGRIAHQAICAKDWELKPRNYYAIIEFKKFTSRTEALKHPRIKIKGRFCPVSKPLQNVHKQKEEAKAAAENKQYKRNCVFMISDYPSDTSVEEIREILKPFGVVDKIEKCEYFTFVYYDDPNVAKKAMEKMRRLDIRGHPVKVAHPSFFTRQMSPQERSYLAARTLRVDNLPSLSKDEVYKFFERDLRSKFDEFGSLLQIKEVPQWFTPPQKKQKTQKNQKNTNGGNQGKPILLVYDTPLSAAKAQIVMDDAEIKGKTIKASIPPPLSISRLFPGFKNPNARATWKPTKFGNGKRNAYTRAQANNLVYPKQYKKKNKRGTLRTTAAPKHFIIDAQTGKCYAIPRAQQQNDDGSLMLVDPPQSQQSQASGSGSGTKRKIESSDSDGPIKKRGRT